MTPALQNLPEACLAGLAKTGLPPRFCCFDPSLKMDGSRIFQDLRDVFALLRRHRVAAHRLVWEFEGGCLMASQRDDGVRCLVTRRPPTEVEHLWSVLEEIV